MNAKSIDLLWPYGPDSDRTVDQMDVVVELEDDSRWVSSFYDTQRFNQGVQGFRGLGPNQDFRFQERMILVSPLDEPTIRSTVGKLLETGCFEEAFERLEPVPDPA
ncbi:MAG: hypothetical protein AAF533_06120 [Acidobacteriota bacterium]